MTKTFAFRVGVVGSRGLVGRSQVPPADGKNGAPLPRKLRMLTSIRRESLPPIRFGFHTALERLPEMRLRFLGHVERLLPLPPEVFFRQRDFVRTER